MSSTRLLPHIFAIIQSSLVNHLHFTHSSPSIEKSNLQKYPKKLYTVTYKYQLLIIPFSPKKSYFNEVHMFAIMLEQLGTPGQGIF